MTEPYLLTASEAGTLMKKGDLTVENYAKSLLSRIQERDAQVKAWAYLDPPFVLEQARNLDQIPAEKRGPLHGIAIGVKDVILTKDMPTKLNSPIYSSSGPSTIDAAPIITLRAAGALILGKTTTTEFAAVTTGPSTTNPHDSTRTPGGSSSGSSAAVAGFQVPIALGTQTGGSTIRPGSFNGIFAWKPTWGAVSREGLAQYSVTCDTVGFYARTVGDLEMLGGVLRVEDDERIPERGFGMEGKRIAFCRTHVWGKAGRGTKNAWEGAKKILASRGAEVEEIELPSDFERISEWHANVLAGEGRTSFLGSMCTLLPEAVFELLTQQDYLLAKEKMHPMLHDHVNNTSKLTRKAQLEAYDGCARLRPVWDELASRYDAVLTPSVVDEAPVGTESTGDASFCSIWTILQVPCLNIPGFQGENGMPIGLTLVGPRYTDEHVLWAGKAIGDVFKEEGGWKSKVV
ncbi:hypothetical protein HYALB_00007566 [Hymenoscyphus albidus]|uniref:Amidase domain-containing protein n=1 Tax=Hymenoscyphus albidus TaxID=595503 RepID=A0A9N9LIQ4_9HELO|nr:hypothetical protein HYALB_00007566 [Hymenoscyphus albidus]